MKTVILAGGLGTRLAEETDSTPKPMVEIGGLPILWHIMKIYAAHGFDEFVVALGYRPEVVKTSSSTTTTSATTSRSDEETAASRSTTATVDDWCVHLVDTGLETQTGGRLKRLEQLGPRRDVHAHLRRRRRDVDLKALRRVPPAHGKLATVTAVRPPARFGGLRSTATSSPSSPRSRRSAKGWINGGFFVLEPGSSTTSRRRHDLGAGAARAARRGRAARRVPPRRLLAVHGHAPRRRLLEGLWQSGGVRGRCGREARLGGSRVLVTGGRG